MPKGIYKHNKQQGFQKGHKTFPGCEKSWFKKGEAPVVHKENCKCFRCTKISPMKDKKWNENQRKGIINANIGKIPWCKGLTKETDERIALSGKKSGNSRKGRKLTKEHIRNSLRRRPKSSLEEKFENIINKLNLPYKFVGNGKFFIERKNPDFINTNGEKIVIEVYCKQFKDKFHKLGCEGWRKEREGIFNKHGWKVLFFDAIQVNEENIKNILGGKYDK